MKLARKRSKRPFDAVKQLAEIIRYFEERYGHYPRREQEALAKELNFKAEKLKRRLYGNK